MLIAQITDIHIGFHRDRLDDPNLARFRQVLDRLCHGPDRPDLLLLTGDLTEHGDAASMAALANALAGCPFPVWPIPGNHDSRAALASAFAQVPQAGFIHYAIDCGDLRLLMLDSLEEGRHGGAFCATRAGWLEAQLAAHPDTPTVIAVHHPPLAVGIDWMDPDPDAAWIGRLGDVVARHNHIRAVLCGHVHRSVASVFRGVPLVICPSSSAGLALDLRHVDPADPDGRSMVVDDDPGFALHHWDGRNLITHFAQAPDARALARYDDRFQQLVIQMAAERS